MSPKNRALHLRHPMNQLQHLETLLGDNPTRHHQDTHLHPRLHHPHHPIYLLDPQMTEGGGEGEGGGESLPGGKSQNLGQDVRRNEC